MLFPNAFLAHTQTIEAECSSRFDHAVTFSRPFWRMSFTSGTEKSIHLDGRAHFMHIRWETSTLYVDLRQDGLAFTLWKRKISNSEMYLLIWFFIDIMVCASNFHRSIKKIVSGSGRTRWYKVSSVASVDGDDDKTVMTTGMSLRMMERDGCQGQFWEDFFAVFFGHEREGGSALCTERPTR